MNRPRIGHETDHKFDGPRSWRLGLWGGLLLSAAAQASSPIPLYPEEGFRSQWDRGCADWVSPAPLISGISVATERRDGVFRILASARIPIENGESLEEVYQSAARQLSDGMGYEDWVMPGINRDSEGNAYFVKLEEASASHYRHPAEFAIRGLYSLQVLWFKREGQTSIIFRHETGALPHCAEAFDLSTPQVVTKVVYRMIPREGVLDYMIGEAYVSRAPDGVRLHLRAVLKPANTLYQVISEKLLRAQVDQRARRIFNNFLNRHRERKRQTASEKN